VVKDWDSLVRSELHDNALWFACLSPKTRSFDKTIIKAGANRRSRAYKDLKDWLDRVGLPFHSPHKFRHGFAVYALKLAKDIGELKAISQNLMHANISTTDGIYGILSNDDKKKLLSKFDLNNSNSSDDINKKLDEVLTLLKQNTPINSE